MGEFQSSSASPSLPHVGRRKPRQEMQGGLCAETPQGHARTPRACAKNSCLHDRRRLVVRALPHLCGLLLSPPPISSSPHRPPPPCSGQPPCLTAPLALAVSARPRMRRPTAALPGIARETTANKSSVLRRCKRKGPLTPGTATAASGAATQSPEKPGAAAASAYASCHSTEYYHLPQQCTLMAAFMCYACYAMDMTWSCNIIRRVLGTLS